MKDNSKFAVAVISGIAAGVALGLLLAPELSEESKRSLANLLKNSSTRLKKFASEEVENITGKKDKLLEEVEDSYAAGKIALENNISDHTP